MKPEDLLNQADKLPNVPEVVRELITDLNSPSTEYKAIATKVKKDQTLSLKILRIVNSAYFGLSRKVSSIEEATILLGMDRLKTLVIASGFANSVDSVEGLDLKQFWSETFQVAEAAKWVAEHSNDIDKDAAFTLGVLHDIGLLLLHLTYPNRAKVIRELVRQGKSTREEAEMERFNFTSTEAGQVLLTRWKFPSQLVDSLAYSKTPLDEKAPKLSAALYIASYIMESHRKKVSIEDIISNYPAEVAISAGISMEVLGNLNELIEKSEALGSMAA
ncbi:HDOD domain-containing protein [Marinomonas mediterranea]|jgi:Predicted signal transduction protein|uniref:Putative signal transduction protein n=1 Tax=Marinomonas mediterranea (strain ATCC 700492 / JCM 21426 / NBRC 103028 / MMB-1) TaxID=717774 RepID=F2JTA0_MARM1|nr:HDOD domain-containing protein [Marinomonas mediterranea]ADZ90318.1 putative signal transduction protein [Marinomonas mediterranea MMB-1]WCN08378.1 HDOD domain-containing protein [Marinomonas mediterranea]WCN12434.1 HDOD domain-containing protein [Marinomonas mediterranea]WCN16507.1 HDOD domain-containing protein [Marinomonas mediterranea MMB-1]